jgi:hypothetical protein
MRAVVLQAPAPQADIRTKLRTGQILGAAVLEP